MNIIKKGGANVRETDTGNNVFEVHMPEVRERVGKHEGRTAETVSSV
jgi:hypothetical protein